MINEIVWRMTTSWEKQQLRPGRKYDRLDTVLYILIGSLAIVGLAGFCYLVLHFKP